MLKILIDNSGYHLRNLGDVAMLQGAARRLWRLDRTLELHVIVSDEERLDRFIPGSLSVGHGLPRGMENGRLFFVPHRLIPSGLLPKVLDWEETQRVINPGLLMRKQGDSKACAKWVKLVGDCDAIIATGGGYLTDAFEGHAMRLLGHISFGQVMGKSTAFFGQGIGPIESPRLMQSVKHVLERVECIGLRESVLGPSILDAYGVECGKFTGDDALEIIDLESEGGWEEASMVGVNVRRSAYAGVTDRGWETLKKGMEAVAKAFEEAFCPIPIDFVSKANDEVSALELIPDGRLSQLYRCPETPGDVLNLVSGCCFLITGSYHAGLFALAQGIPIIGIEASDYYKGKFDGLEAIYEGGVMRYEPNEGSVEGLVELSRKAKAVSIGKRQGWRERSRELKEAGRQLYGQFYESLC